MLKQPILKNQNRIYVLQWALVLSVMILAGCAIVGRVVPEDRLILFSENKALEGTFGYGSLRVDYRYTTEGEILNVSGAIDFRQRLDSLDVRLLLVDGVGTVLQQKIVYSSGYRSRRMRGEAKNFNADFNLSPEVKGFTFVYSGNTATGSK